MIEVEINSKRFAGQAILGPITFRVTAGETLAIVGPSGIGKSTLLRIVAGVDTEFDGTVTKPEATAFVFQEPTLLPWRSVVQNLLLLHPQLKLETALSMLARVGLEGKDGLFPGQLSLGQQRRLSLARAFCGAPELLILDEPFVSLDGETAEIMLKLTESLIAEHQPATLFVTHDMREADRLADRILTLRSDPAGAIVEAISPRTTPA